MDWRVAAAAALIGYVIGSISFARIVAKLGGSDADLTRTDVPLPHGEQLVFRSVSATTVRVHLGRRYGCVTALLDMAKVAVPTLVFRLWAPDQPYYLIVAAAGVIGHVLPIYHHLRGGRGESPIYGGLIVIDPIAIVGTTLLGFAVGFVIGNILAVRWAGMVLLIPWLWIATGDPWALAYIVVVDAVYALAILPEFRQYLAMVGRGSEPTNEAIAVELAMGAGLGRALDRYGVLPRIVRAVRASKRPSR